MQALPHRRTPTNHDPQIAMNRIALSALVLGVTSLGFAAPVAEPAPAPFHCQVPCGIYGDAMRIQMMREDADTIAKGMAQIREMEAADSFAHNQMVRWVMTKDEHAAGIQEQVASYWLAQRIKSPKERSGREKYLRQLELMHGITVAAMKCKQTTDATHVDTIRSLANEFSATYFSEEELKHLKGH